MQERVVSSVNICIISNIILEPFFNSLIKEHFIECKVKIHPIPYGEHMEQAYQTQLSASDEIIVWINLENLLQTYDSDQGLMKSEQPTIDGVLNICRRLSTDIAQNSNARVIWFLFEDYNTKIPIATGYTYASLADKLNLELVNQLYNQVDFIDLKQLIAKVGIDNAYNSKGKYRWNAPYSKMLVETVIMELHKQYLIAKGITKKCMVLDCDNVLWGGILSEDGIENLKLSVSGSGRVYQDFQRFVLSMYYHGVILAICSKNDLSDVLKMFHEHSEMILKEEHIACFQVNWEDKPGNIIKIAERLNIGLESIVFVDDSPVEIEAVKSMIPNVTTILFKKDMEYEQFSCFNLTNYISISDIEKRNETYRTNGFREELKVEYTDYADYIKALEIKTDIHKAMPIEYSRISELTQRTNKCTNGKRYTITEIKERVSYDVVNLYSVSVADRFSDLGIVGAIEIEGNSLTLFSLSCRALGREIEKKMLVFITNECNKINNIEFQSTGKNEGLKSILLDAFPDIIF